MLQSFVYATFVGSETIPYKDSTLTKWWFKSNTLRGDNFPVRVREVTAEPTPGSYCLLEVQTWPNVVRDKGVLSHVLVNCQVAEDSVA